MNRRRQFLQWAGGVALQPFLPRAARAAQTRVLTGPAFASAWRLVMPAGAEAAAARARVEQVVAPIDARMSPFRADSELGRFNAQGDRIVSLETAMLTRAALDLARASAGAFDPTAAPLSRRFGFGSLAIGAARPAGRYGDLQVLGRELRTSCPGLSVDLCGIAKGYALEEIVRALDGLDFMIELGGEVAARGRHPSGRAWRVGIEQPGADRVQRVVRPGPLALATSGDAAQYFEAGARRYSHVIDPRSRMPVNNGVASVSVLAATGWLADGLSTAAMVLGPRDARALLEAHDASALFLLRRPGGFEEVSLNGFLERNSS